MNVNTLLKNGKVSAFSSFFKLPNFSFLCVLFSEYREVPLIIAVQLVQIANCPFIKTGFNWNHTINTLGLIFLVRLLNQSIYNLNVTPNLL